ncbi:hypothetical protein SAY87_007239 [Trapa incisa]|uniref:Uncharacterized protein n=1 Tax=Trapa incisa TaxID=236973 RepID=A0AAN7PZX1_9MYRT|nr:hypothetical protein SAY87_007239 [Trapa incisa]
MFEITFGNLRYFYTISCSFLLLTFESDRLYEARWILNKTEIMLEAVTSFQEKTTVTLEILVFHADPRSSVLSNHCFAPQRGQQKQLIDENELKETKIITALNEEGQEENHCQPSGALGLEFGHQDGGMSRYTAASPELTKAFLCCGLRQCLRAFAVSNHKPNKGTWSGRGIWTMLWQVNAGLWQETIGQE